MDQQRLLFLILVVIVLTKAQARGVTISSYLRNPATNAAAGGVSNSLHLVGLAMDLVGPWTELERVAILWRSLGLDAVLESDHLHIELDGPALR